MKRKMFLYNVYTGRYWDGEWFSARRRNAVPATIEALRGLAAKLPAQVSNIRCVLGKS